MYGASCTAKGGRCLRPILSVFGVILRVITSTSTRPRGGRRRGESVSTRLDMNIIVTFQETSGFDRDAELILIFGRLPLPEDVGLKAADAVRPVVCRHVGDDAVCFILPVAKESPTVGGVCTTFSAAIALAALEAPDIDARNTRSVVACPRKFCGEMEVDFKLRLGDNDERLLLPVEVP